MYLINKSQNRIIKLNKKTFSELGFRERDHLQEWLANNPQSLGEDLLIIQKEFSGFSDTNERLDLLALDKQGNLVIIENKLDDSGRDVVWQSLKYASYCSTLSTPQIRNIYQQYLDKQGNNEKSDDKLLEFFNLEDMEEVSLNRGQTQRIILIAANFRKEITSTVLWLMNYQLRVQCFKVSPYALDDQLFLNVEQIIPLKDAEEYMIGMAEKTRDEIGSQEELKGRHQIRLEFWKKLLKEINSRSSLFQNISPSKDNWISTGSGVSMVVYQFSITGSYAGVSLYMSRPNTAENKYIFDELHKDHDHINQEFGSELEWRRLDDKKGSDIIYRLSDVSVFNQDDWPMMIDFQVDAMIRLEKAFNKPLKRIGLQLKNKEI